MVEDSIRRLRECVRGLAPTLYLQSKNANDTDPIFPSTEKGE